MPLEALGPFVGLVEFLNRGAQRQDDRNRAALGALRKALLETRIYLRDRERGFARDQNRENTIVLLWGEAGTEFRGVDSDLAMICHYKSEYWISPDEWSDERIAQRRIGIDALFERYGALLNVAGAVLTPQQKSLLQRFRQQR